MQSRVQDQPCMPARIGFVAGHTRLLRRSLASSNVPGGAALPFQLCFHAGCDAVMNISSIIWLGSRCAGKELTARAHLGHELGDAVCEGREHQHVGIGREGELVEIVEVVRHRPLRDVSLLRDRGIPLLRRAAVRHPLLHELAQHTLLFDRGLHACMSVSLTIQFRVGWCPGLHRSRPCAMPGRMQKHREHGFRDGHARRLILRRWPRDLKGAYGSMPAMLAGGRAIAAADGNHSATVLRHEPTPMHARRCRKNV